jgi:hypothetical protein
MALGPADDPGAGGETSTRPDVASGTGAATRSSRPGATIAYAHIEAAA